MDEAFGSFQADDARRQQQLKQEKAPLRKPVTECDPEIEVMRESAAKKCMTCSARARAELVLTKAVRLNVSGLSRVDCCCSQAMMRCARFIPT